MFTLDDMARHLRLVAPPQGKRDQDYLEQMDLDRLIEELDRADEIADHEFILSDLWEMVS